MQQILDQFGVQPILLLAQVVNFLVLLVILKKLLYKPLLRVLEQRKLSIAQSIKNNEEIEKRLTALSLEEEKRILKAVSEGEKIIKQAQEAGVQIIEEAKIKSEESAEKIIQDANISLQIEKEKVQQEMREDLSNIVTMALEKVVGKTLTGVIQKKMVDETLRRMS